MKAVRFILIAATAAVLTAPVAQAQTHVTSGNGQYDKDALAQRQAAMQAAPSRNASVGSAAPLRYANDRDARRGRNGRDVTVVIGNQPNCAPVGVPVGVPVYPGYPQYPAYGAPAYPYGYLPPTYGTSVSVSTPGYSDGTYTVFPWSTTVSTYGNAPGHYPRYQSYPSYPAYPTYVPGNVINGYRGAASPTVITNMIPYSYTTGTFLGGSYGVGTGIGSFSIGRSSTSSGFSVGR